MLMLQASNCQPENILFKVKQKNSALKQITSCIPCENCRRNISPSPKYLIMNNATINSENCVLSCLDLKSLRAFNRRSCNIVCGHL